MKNTACQRNFRAAADREFIVGDEVLIFRENIIGKWTGPYLIQKKDSKMLTLDTGDRLIREALDKVKQYLN